jgi:hypothetical protein
MLMKTPVQPTPASRSPDPSGSQPGARGASPDGVEIRADAIVFRHDGGPATIRHGVLLSASSGRSDPLSCTPANP